MAPGLAFGLMALSGLLILLKAREACTALVTRHDVIFVLGLLGLVAVSFTLMRYSGPVLAGLFADGGDYRALRDTTPWKHLGFVFGGGGMVAALISWMERRVTLRAVLIGFAAMVSPSAGVSLAPWAYASQPKVTSPPPRMPWMTGSSSRA